MKHINLINITFLTLSFTWAIGLIWANPELTQPATQNSSHKVIYLAGKNIDAAWKAFHEAALGGTLASPMIQTQIELALHKSRLLLVDARKAAESKNTQTVFDLTEKIRKMTNQIKENSKRHKQ